MHKGFISIAALIGGLSVVLGAFAAHKLKQILTAEALQVFETAVRYQFYHVFALLAVGILYKDFGGNLLNWSGIMFLLGILFFSGSLYGLSYAKAKSLDSFNWLGPITPLGGLCFIIGWVLLFIAIIKK